ncbi:MULTISPECIES: reverse transcriptase domain-containing protein [unclassified Stenotrophomonas]|uniref:reverse transcriptase domain-containing protein n=1 Tax=unclassified Stenotrophomonas TaxID=196198 RepID=UPI00244C7140|nr:MULTISPECIES: reverse transcriptase domain-containing protein [unclassified Stenotrophomonas]MBN5160281.1 hypothetical protein [Stenotrophomonas maltophilia]MDG9845205.1 reverse transcriptase domain-containing protein [Stenotrophomonas sp. GD04054]MDH0016443.1 reverse transcriptase domain-containing protein [Stenotrophomonas sp. GD04028]MDH0576682.1 reverse transcriptase domain-containing protein [Stenotrophomonas sp. GD03997]MDH0860621.1 reverse transcriptase domain-containing protein [Ste
MISEKDLAAEIVLECNKLIRRYEVYHNNLHAETVRMARRLGVVPAKIVIKPDYWKKNKKFDPFYCRGRARAMARSIVRKIILKTYSPEPPHEKDIPKASGGKRKLRIYQIPDAVVSKIVYERMLSKNRHRFSAFSYAYRDDRNVHFAIQDMHSDISGFDRAYIAEYDFSDFFGNISHRHLEEQLNSNGLLISDEDEWILKKFLLSDRGIPQGTSVSLFLANVACLSLDKSLEKIGVKFARYADDTVICSDSYDSICRAVRCISEFSRQSEVKINFAKSEGISMLSDMTGKAEMREKHSFDFLGYAVSMRALGIKKSSEQRIKKRISYLLYRNLLQPLKGPALAGVRVPVGYDPDLITAMLQVRRYVCGSLYKSDFHNYLNSGIGQIRFRGVMSFYPLVTDEEQLMSLDGWLTSTVFRVLKLRARKYAAHGHPSVGAVFPFGVPKARLVSALDSMSYSGRKLLEIPSFLLVSRAMRKAINEHGISYVMDPKSSRYAYRT